MTPTPTPTLISSYKAIEGKIHVRTPYCEDVVSQCRQWAGKFIDGAWVLPDTCLADVQEMLGEDLHDLVQVKVYGAELNCCGAQERVGWYVCAGRRGRDYAADVYAELIGGTIPRTGGSVKNPSVNSSDDVVYRLWVPRDFALARKLEIVAEATPAAPPGADARALAIQQIRDLMVAHGITAAEVS